MTTTSTALATMQPGPSALALRPSNIEEAIKLAELMAGSPLLPAELQKPASLFLMILQAQDLGLSVPQAIRGVHIIKGKPVMAADLMVAVCLGRPHVCRYFRVAKDSPGEVIYETFRVGHDEPTRAGFTMDEAKAAGLLGKADSNWSKFPQDMLHARAKARLARRVYSDLLFGVRASEEVADGVIDVVEAAPGQYVAPGVTPEAVAPTTVIPAEPSPSVSVRQSPAARLADMITSAATMGQLQHAASEITAAGDSIRDEERKALRDLYSEAKRHLTQPPPREREPGEEG